MASEGSRVFSPLPPSAPLLLRTPASCLISLAFFFSLPRFSLSPYFWAFRLALSALCGLFFTAQSVKLVLVKTRICGFLLLTIIHQKQPFYPLARPLHHNLYLLRFVLLQLHCCFGLLISLFLCKDDIRISP